MSKIFKRRSGLGVDGRFFPRLPKDSDSLFADAKSDDLHYDGELISDNTVNATAPRGEEACFDINSEEFGATATDPFVPNWTQCENDAETESRQSEVVEQAQSHEEDEIVKFVHLLEKSDSSEEMKTLLVSILESNKSEELRAYLHIGSTDGKEIRKDNKATDPDFDCRPDKYKKQTARRNSLGNSGSSKSNNNYSEAAKDSSTRGRKERSTLSGRQRRSQSPQKAARPRRSQSPQKAARPRRSQSPQKAARPRRSQSPQRVPRPRRSQSPQRVARRRSSKINIPMADYKEILSASNHVPSRRSGLTRSGSQRRMKKGGAERFDRSKYSSASMMHLGSTRRDSNTRLPHKIHSSVTSKSDATPSGHENASWGVISEPSPGLVTVDKARNNSSGKTDEVGNAIDENSDDVDNVSISSASGEDSDSLLQTKDRFVPLAGSYQSAKREQSQGLDDLLDDLRLNRDSSNGSGMNTPDENSKEKKGLRKFLVRQLTKTKLISEDKAPDISHSQKDKLNCPSL